MVDREIQLYAHRDCYQVEGNSHVVVWKPMGGVVLETPEIGLRVGIEGSAVKGFFLDEKTSELIFEFLQSGNLARINIGIVRSKLQEANHWINRVNILYKH